MNNGETEQLELQTLHVSVSECVFHIGRHLFPTVVFIVSYGLIAWCCESMSTYVAPLRSALALMASTLPEPVYIECERELCRRISSSPGCACSDLLQQVHCFGTVLYDFLRNTSTLPFSSIVRRQCGAGCCSLARIPPASSFAALCDDAYVDRQNIGLVLLHIVHALYENSLLVASCCDCYLYAWLGTLVSIELGAVYFVQLYVSAYPDLATLLGGTLPREDVTSQPWDFLKWYEHLMCKQQTPDLVVPVVNDTLYSWWITPR